MAPACPFSAALSGTADGGFATPFSFLDLSPGGLAGRKAFGRKRLWRGCRRRLSPLFLRRGVAKPPAPTLRPPLIYTRTLYSRRPARFQGSFLGQQQYIEAAKAAFKRRYGPMIEIIRRALARAKSRP